MEPIKSETSRVSDHCPATMFRHAAGRRVGHLVQPKHANWYLMAGSPHGKLWACPSYSFTGRVLP